MCDIQQISKKFKECSSEKEDVGIMIKNKVVWVCWECWEKIADTDIEW